MRRVLVALALLGAPAVADEWKTELSADALLRQEWTRDIFVSATELRNEDRQRFQLRPRVEVSVAKVGFGVGGDFNYSSDVNLLDPKPRLLRDNYDSRDARLDLAFVRLDPVGWLRIQGGRFEMPVGLTEMTWDRDLRPQGGAVTLQARDLSERVRSLSATGLFAQGSHVFDDRDARMTLISGEASFDLGQSPETRLQLVGSWLRWDRIASIETMIRRQNTRLAGDYQLQYHVVDAVARFRRDGRMTLQVVGDYCWNTAADSSNRGVWLAVVLGSLKTARGRLEYTYANLDKDATLAAYGTDDFFWVTGWEGHRGDLGLRVSDFIDAHGVGQVQRFKDSANLAERDHWVKRFRIELRLHGSHAW